MESTAWPLSVLALLVIFFVLFKPPFRRRKLNLPPGPKPWPIIGNLNLIGALPHRSIHELSLKYGSIMQLQFGSFPVVVVSSSETAKEILQTQDLKFASRPKTAAGKYTTYNYSNITWSPYGAYWRQARKICVTELFSQRRLDSFQHIRVEETMALLAGLFARAGTSVIIKDHLATVSLGIISRMVFGKKYSDEAEAAKASIPGQGEFKRMIDELFLLNGVFNLGDYIPWIDFLDFQGYIKRMKALSKKFNRFLEHVIEEHESRRMSETKLSATRDMVDVLLLLADDPGMEVKLSRTSIKAVTQDLLAGGTESSSITVEWALSELLRQPQMLDKAREELDRVIGKQRWVEEKDMADLPYIDAIMKETMRLHPVAPMLPPRVAREDCKLAGYDVPAGTRVLVNAGTIGKEPALWESPEEFRPERFLGQAIDIKGQSFELLPFGAGRRMCPGYSLGLKVIQLTLANLLHGFTWSLPEGMAAEDLNMEELWGMSTPRKVPLLVVGLPRLASQMYRGLV